MYEIAPATYEIPQEEGMLVPGLLIATKELIEEMDIERPLQQLRNVAHLPGIVGHSIAMPDIHWGYGFPIGGVAAMDALDGVISPGGVGYDINCGVRLALIPIPMKDFSPEMKKQLIEKIYSLVPSGVGKGQRGKKKLTRADYEALTQKGAAWSIEQGFGYKEDLDHTESHGYIEGGDLSSVSQHAQERGADQLGTIGSGNHFVEIGEIEKIFLQDIAKKWGVEEGMTYALIHSGSRGFGHQVCQDTLTSFIQKKFHEGLPDRQLVPGDMRRASSGRTVAEGMPDAYKNISAVVEAVEMAGLAKRVALQKPHLVLKGKPSK